MKIFVDENIPLMTLRILREVGHDVRDIHNTGDKGMADEDVWAMVQKEGRLLITTDKGFTQQREESHHGILIIRLKKPNRYRIHERVLQAITGFREDEWPGLLVVMRDNAQSIWRAGALKSIGK